MLGEIASMRLKDLEIFETVSRVHSIREAARRLHLAPGQVSKAVRGLETLVGTRLFKRSVGGVLLTSQGHELHAIVADLLLNAGRIESLLSGRDQAKFAKVLAIAGTSFLNSGFTVPLVCRAAPRWPRNEFRFLDLAPDQIVAVGLRGGFDLAVHFESLDWPGTWVTKRLGATSWRLCARASHPLPKKPTLRQILEYPFVVPTYWTTEGLVRGNDQFPVPLAKRKTGFETATADAAVPILLESDQLAFLPDLLVRGLLAEGKLRELRTKEVAVVEKQLFLSAKSDSVPNALYYDLVRTMTANLA